MADADFLRAANAGREFSVSDGGVSIRVRLPTRLAMQRIIARTGTEIAAAQEDILAVAVVGWEGVPASRLVGGAEGSLAFSPALVPLVLDEYPKLADQAFTQLVDRFAARREAAEAAAKN